MLLLSFLCYAEFNKENFIKLLEMTSWHTIDNY